MNPSFNKQYNKQSKILFSEIQNTRYWNEFKDQQRLLYSFYYAIRMGNKFSHELSMICLTILTVSTILKIFSQKYFQCKAQMIVLDLQFSIIGISIMIFFVLPTVKLNQEFLLSIPKISLNDMNDSILQLQNELLGRSPITSTFSNLIDSQIYLNDVLFVYYRPVLLVHVLRQFIIIHHQSMIFSGSLLQEHLIAGLQLTCAILIYMQIDISLQYSDECSRKKDIQVMKIIHDLKNPVISISQTINDDDYQNTDKDSVKKIINTELNELEDMLESLRTEFKSRHQMEIKEVVTQVDSLEFAVQFKRAFTKLAINGGNRLSICSQEKFPIKICIQKSNVKRIINNLISNSLKHTMEGEVKVMLKIVEIDQIKEILNSVKKPEVFIEPKNQSLKSNNNIVNQILVEVSDNGSGISRDILPHIFKEKQSDENETNWDGMGLGLPICSYMCQKMDAFIIYKSTPGDQTLFQFQQPNNQISKKISLSMTNIGLTDQVKEIDENIQIQLSVNVIDKTFKDIEHICNSAYIAEDNPNILSKYEKIFKKRSIPQKSFENGMKLQNHLNHMSCFKCQEILVFTDQNMPQMDGKELATKLRKLEGNSFSKICIILISAEDYDNSDRLFNNVFFKPIIPKSLISVQNEFYNNENYCEINSLCIKNNNSLNNNDNDQTKDINTPLINNK